MSPPDPLTVARAVCQVMTGSDARQLLASHRGSPRTADLRAVSMLLWRDLHTRNPPCYTAIGAAFGRDRRSVSRGLQRVAQRGLPSDTERREIMRVLGKVKG